MKTHGKKYRAAAEKVTAPAYAPKAALELVKSAAFAKFDESVEVAVRLGVDPRHADQVVRGTVSSRPAPARASASSSSPSARRRRKRRPPAPISSGRSTSRR